MQKLLIPVIAILALSQNVFAEDLDKAKALVDSIRLPDPPEVSTTTKPSPVGQPATDYHPSGPGLDIVEPPSPVNALNPQNDPDVQRGLDSYQKPQ